MMARAALFLAGRPGLKLAEASDYMAAMQDNCNVRPRFAFGGRTSAKTAQQSSQGKSHYPIASSAPVGLHSEIGPNFKWPSLNALVML